MLRQNGLRLGLMLRRRPFHPPLSPRLPCLRFGRRSSRTRGEAMPAMNEFLEPTATLDSTDSTIVTAAAEIVGDATADEEVARRCFLWVRDSVRHSSDHQVSVVTCTASDVLKHRAGFC